MIEAIAGVNALQRCKSGLGAPAGTTDDEKQVLDERSDSEDSDAHTEFVPLMVANEVHCACAGAFVGQQISPSCDVCLCLWSCRNTMR